MPNPHQSYDRPPNVTHKSPRRGPESGAGVLVPVGGWGKHIVIVLGHARHEPLCESFCCRVEVVQHCVAAPPTHEADRVCVDSRHEEGHGAASPHRACADVVWCEPHLESDDCGCGTECCSDFCTSDCVPLVSFEKCSEMRFWGGRCAVVSVPHGAGWLPLYIRGGVLLRRVQLILL